MGSEWPAGLGAWRWSSFFSGLNHLCEFKPGPGGYMVLFPVVLVTQRCCHGEDGVLGMNKIFGLCHSHHPWVNPSSFSPPAACRSCHCYILTFQAGTNSNIPNFPELQKDGSDPNRSSRAPQRWQGTHSPFFLPGFQQRLLC